MLGIEICQLRFTFANILLLDRLQSMATQLQSTSMDLNLSIKDCSTPTSMINSDDQKLLNLSKNVSDTAQTLMVEIARLSLSGAPSKREAVSRTFKSLRQKRKIEDIRKKLEQYQAFLESQLMLDLR